MINDFEIVGPLDMDDSRVRTNRCIVVDMDTTLCDNTHRENMPPEKGAENEDEKWDAFFRAAHADDTYEDVLAIIEAMAPTTDIVILTARENRYADISEDWLNARNIPFSVLIHKPDGDTRKAANFKVDLLREIEKRYGKILFCLEDQTAIVKAMREAGFSAFDVRKSYNDR